MIEVTGLRQQKETTDSRSARRFAFESAEKLSKLPIYIALLLTGIAVYFKSALPARAETHSEPEPGPGPSSSESGGAPVDFGRATAVRPDAMSSVEENRERAERLEPLDFFGQAPTRGNVVDFPLSMKLMNVTSNPFNLDTLPLIEAGATSSFELTSARVMPSSNRTGGEAATQPEDVGDDDLLEQLLEALNKGIGGDGDAETPVSSPSDDPEPHSDPDPDDDPEEPRRGNRAPTVAGQNRLNDVMLAQVVLIGLSELLMNTEDADGDELTVTDVHVSSGHVAAHEAFWIYTPDPDHLGEVKVTYSVSDGLETIAHSASFNVVDKEGPTPSGSATLGDDWLVGSAAADVFDGLAGNDTIESFGGDDVIRGGDGNDTIRAGASNDIVFAGSGDDVVSAGAGDDEVHGEDGDDSIDGDEGDDTLSGGDGDDRIAGNIGNDILRGDGGNDTLDGGEGDDRVFGGDGDDIIMASTGADFAEGGEGRDIMQGGGGNDTLSGGTGDDLLAGGDGDDSIDGDADDDTLHGDAGNDALDGGDGDDSMFGGDGEDVILASAGADYAEGGEGRDIIQGNQGSDSLHGGGGSDMLSGGEGDDTLAGDEHDDTLYGDAGNDTLDGGDGDDSIFAGEGADIVAGGDGSDYLEGEEGDDVIDAGAGADVVLAGDGDDIVDAGAGSDTVSAGNGNDLIIVTLDADGDVYDGGDGSDALDMSRASSGVSVDLVNGTVSSGEMGTDIITGFEKIIGGSGNDNFQAGGQSTVFAGSGGDDTFTFAMAASSGIGAGELVHQIIDFMVGDRVMVEQFEISGTARNAAEDLFSRVYEGQANGGNDVPIRIRYERFDGMDHTIIDVDFDMNNEFEMSIDIYGHHTPYVYNTVA